MSHEHPLNGLSVLVVDDDDDCRELTALTLQMAGAHVCTASSVADAIAVLSQEWDAVVTDIGMPSLSGYDLMREVRQKEPQIPVIAVTGFTTPEHRRQLAESGFAAHLTKPVAPGGLVDSVWGSVRSALDASRATEIRNLNGSDIAAEGGEISAEAASPA